jgi:hypothetical protein
VSQGSILVWVPAGEQLLTAGGEADKLERRIFKVIRDVGAYVARTQPTQPVLLSWPAGLAAEQQAKCTAEVERVLGEGVKVLTHSWSFRPPEKDAAGGVGSYSTSAWIVFVDSFGSVRAASPLLMGKPRDEAGFDRWLKVFREHGRPPRELPELVREASEPAKK